MFIFNFMSNEFKAFSRDSVSDGLKMDRNSQDFHSIDKDLKNSSKSMDLKGFNKQTTVKINTEDFASFLSEAKQIMSKIISYEETIKKFLILMERAKKSFDPDALNDSLNKIFFTLKEHKKYLSSIFHESHMAHDSTLKINENLEELLKYTQNLLSNNEVVFEKIQITLPSIDKIHDGLSKLSSIIMTMESIKEYLSNNLALQNIITSSMADITNMKRDLPQTLSYTSEILQISKALEKKVENISLDLPGKLEMKNLGSQISDIVQLLEEQKSNNGKNESLMKIIEQFYEIREKLGKDLVENLDPIKEKFKILLDLTNSIPQNISNSFESILERKIEVLKGDNQILRESLKTLGNSLGNTLGNTLSNTLDTKLEDFQREISRKITALETEISSSLSSNIKKSESKELYKIETIHQDLEKLERKYSEIIENSQNLQKTVVNLFSKLLDKFQENEGVKFLTEENFIKIIEGLLFKMENNILDIVKQLLNTQINSINESINSIRSKQDVLDEKLSKLLDIIERNS